MSFRSKDLAVVLEEKRLWLGCPNTGGPPQEPPPPCPNSKPQCPQGTKRPGGRAVAGGLEDLRQQLRQTLSGAH